MKRLIVSLQENRIFRFLVSGGTAVLANISSLLLLTEYFHFYYLYSSIVAFFIGFLVTFFLQKFWTFRNTDRSKTAKQMMSTLIVAGVNLLINTFFVYVFVEWVGMWYMLAQIMSSLLISLETYFLYRNFIFRE
jgi:dolichol-phosphate mannosyltransferase